MSDRRVLKWQKYTFVIDMEKQDDQSGVVELKYFYHKRYVALFFSSVNPTLFHGAPVSHPGPGKRDSEKA